MGEPTSQIVGDDLRKTKLKILGKAKDQRTDTRVVYAQISVDEYLNLVGDDFDLFSIQRRREKHRGYDRLKTDAASGALLPAITLAYDPHSVAPLQALFDKGDQASDTELEDALSIPRKARILDGLQRTYILHELRINGTAFKAGQTLLVEFWLEDDPRNLIYRIIVLNAGQKPMSMRHQIEILFSTFIAILKSKIPGLDLLTERDGRRRTQSRKYPLDRVVASYQAFLFKDTEIQKENIVAQRIKEEDILAGSEDSLNQSFNDFTEFLKHYVELDDEICRIYVGPPQGISTKGTEWFGNGNVMIAFFAAVAEFLSKPERAKRVTDAIESLKATLRSAQAGEDPLGLLTLEQITQGFDTKKVNVGHATRKQLFNSFKGFFRDAGEKPLAEVWASEAD